MLTSEQIQQFEAHGYVVLDNFVSMTKLAELKQAAAEIVDEFDLEAQGSIFTTLRRPEDLDNYFLSSGDKVRCFLEEDGFDEGGRLKLSKAQSINKIGHAMHDLHPVFDAFSRDPRLCTVLNQVGLVEPKIWQSMYIFKQADIGGEVAWHQDATYFLTEPLSVKTLWFAVDDATLDNGCLWVADCGADTPLRSIFQVVDGVAETVKLDDTPWPSLTDAKPLEVAAGTLVCFDGLLPHYSAANRSSRARHAYTLHVVDGQAHYPGTNWIQRSRDFPVRGFN